ncbi:hypothetical protein AXG93_4343s1580 [Marchantia polymorpha subsp. ruderalis]|uniref:MutL C-terminal dimerisation domain-containing protein n=1 Tax=Marchantia polymorpha subsp. ruderalis TaxID=1480154 RepID=A0A176VUB0_MARPO|nr:hypothetical protein AXG93_4343s1580 [Marchantia polymorpha subsp. ruderalis]
MLQIRRLSDSIVNRLRSSTVLLDVAQIAEELVCNSIDAGATQIQVDVDAEAYFMKVDDDGCGIQRDDLTLVGERHVVVKDMFYNQPVRRRLLNTRKIPQSVKERVMRFVLMHPKISFKVTDLARQEVSVHSKSATSMGTTLSGMFDINRRFVKKTPIHKLLNTWAQSKNNDSRALVVTSTQRGTYEKRGTGKQDGIGDKHLFPAFVLNLICPLSEYDITFEASKTLVEFKDWQPVVDFVRGILRSIWGDLSSVFEGGSLHASPRSPELSVKADSRSKTVRQQTSSSLYTASNMIPPMSVRRALVQGGLSDRCSPVKGSAIEHKGVDIASHGSRQSRCKQRERPSPTQNESDKGNLSSGTFVTGGVTIGKFLAESPSHRDDQSLAPRGWTLASCRQAQTLSKSILSSKDIDVFVPCFEAPRSPCDSDSLTTLRLEPFPDNISRKPTCTVDRIRSRFDFLHSPTRPFLVKSYTESTLADGMTEQSQDLIPYTKLAKFRSCRLGENMDIERGGASSEVPDLNMRASLWSGSDDSYDYTSKPDSLDLLPEVRSRSPDGSEVQESFAWMCSGSDPEDKCITHGKGLTRSETNGLERFDLNDFDHLEESSRFSLLRTQMSITEQEEGEQEVGERLELKSERSVRFKLEAQDWRDHEDFDQQATNIFSWNPSKIGSEGQESWNRDLSDASGRKSDYCRPRVKRKLETFLSGQSAQLLSPSGNTVEHETRKYDSEREWCIISSKRHRRSQSGPPFYIPPNRCGIHDNPPNSLSTIKKVLVEISERSDHNRREAVLSAAAQRSEKSTCQTSHYDTCAMDTTSASSFSASCIRNGQACIADDLVERPLTEGGCSGPASVQKVLPDVGSVGLDQTAHTDDAIQDMLKEFSNSYMTKDGGVLDLSSGILCWNSMSFLPESIVKESLQHARVLQQVDKKFIPAVADGVLLIIDQHAADERVRLEELRDDVLGSGQFGQASPLSCTQQLVPCILGVMLSGADLMEYLRQLMDTQGSSAPPPAVIRVLNNKACRGAIMFGDTLLPVECTQLVEHLKKTSLCFQCAHGRPTMVPLVDLRALHKRLRLTDSSCGISKNHELPTGALAAVSDMPVKEWHRLQSTRSTLKRSLERLNQARQ